MAEIGRYNKLIINRETDFGVYLNGEELGEILMPKKYLPKSWEIDDEVEVFVYLDSEDRLVATTEQPYAQVGDFALLGAVAVNTIGAFFDWGLLKDLLVPYREQKGRIEKGQSYIVYIYLDEESNRIAGSTNLNKYLNKTDASYEENQEVDLFIVNKTELGYNAIINKSHIGMLYQNEVFQTLKRGQTLKGFIKKIRDDDKIDLCLQKAGFEKVDDLTSKIISELEEWGGFINVNDKSDPDTIYDLFEVSKKTFKKAIGSLYKKRLITIEKNGIKLIESES